MHTYKKVFYTKDPAYSVGYWHIEGKEDSWRSEWHETKRFDTEKEAASYARYLNGGATENA